MKKITSVHWFLRLGLLFFLVVFCWFVIGYQLPRFLPTAQLTNTTKLGFIWRNEIWSGEIKVVGDVVALPGTTVTIEPGSQVLVKKDGDQFNVHWWPWEIRSGLNTGEESLGVKNGELFWDERQKIQIHFAKLLVWGTKEQPVEIRSDEIRPGSPYDFNVISAEAGILSHVQMANFRKFSVGEAVTVRDSEFNTTGECAVCVEFTNPSIINNVFGESLRAGILVMGGSPKISDNLFSGSLGEGIVVDPQRFGAPLIYHNSFETPTKVALHFLTGGEELGGAVSLNDFTGSSEIVIPCDSKVKFVQNHIRGILKLAPSSSCAGSLSLGPNFWDSLDKQAILREKIVGREEQFEVLLPSVLKEIPAGVGRRIN